MKVPHRYVIRTVPVLFNACYMSYKFNYALFTHIAISGEEQ